MRHSSSFNTARIEHLYLDEWVRDMKKSYLINLHWGDMTGNSSLIRIISDIRPTDIYNLAAQSHVKVSFDILEYTAEATPLVHFTPLKPYVFVALKKHAESIKHQHQNYMGKYRKWHKKRPHHFIPVHHTV